jgi:hypothetical protein
MLRKDAVCHVPIAKNPYRYLLKIRLDNKKGTATPPLMIGSINMVSEANG